MGYGPPFPAPLGAPRWKGSWQGPQEELVSGAVASVGCHSELV